MDLNLQKMSKKAPTYRKGRMLDWFSAGFNSRYTVNYIERIEYRYKVIYEIILMLKEKLWVWGKL